MPREDLALDQGRDLDGRSFHRLDKLYAAPGWVKAAGRTELCGDDLPGHMYADPVNLLYPTHTKAATWTSAAFFLENRADLSPARAELLHGRLMKMAEFFNIRADVEALESRHAELANHDDARLPDDAFAYVKVAADGTKQRRLRLANAVEVKTAAEWLQKYQDQFIFDERQAIATKILEKAAEYGASTGNTGDFLERAAGFGVCSASEALALIRQRAVLARAKHASAAAQLTKLANELEAQPETLRDLGAMAKLATILEQTDVVAGIQPGGVVRRPIEVLFAVTQKAATTYLAERVMSPSGATYDRDELAALPLEEVRGHLGDEVAEAATRDGLAVDPEKLAEVLPTLTRGDGERFDRLAARVGVRPIRKQAAAAPQGLTREDILAFASQHRRG